MYDAFEVCFGCKVLQPKTINFLSQRRNILIRYYLYLCMNFIKYKNVSFVCNYAGNKCYFLNLGFDELFLVEV